MSLSLPTFDRVLAQIPVDDRRRLGPRSRQPVQAKADHLRRLSSGEPARHRLDAPWPMERAREHDLAVAPLFGQGREQFVEISARVDVADTGRRDGSEQPDRIDDRAAADRLDERRAAAIGASGNCRQHETIAMRSVRTSREQSNVRVPALERLHGRQRAESSMELVRSW